MTRNIISVLSWIIVAWICKVFLSSIPYKFTNHPDTQHIFGTIGEWIKNVINYDLGAFFVEYGAYIIGSFEILVCIVLLLPIVLFIIKSLHSELVFPSRSLIHGAGGLMASVVMSGAVFFHMFTPLGIEVLHNGTSDNGSLFYAAVSIVFLGIILFLMNLQSWMTSNKVSI